MYISHIKHEYENFILDVSDLRLENNSIIGLVGENGAGKSTLMSLLAGYKKANREFNVTDFEFEDVVFVPTDVELYEYLTVGEFIRFCIKYSDSSKNIKEILASLDMLDKENSIIESLSQGMKKKLTLIPIFISKYKYIILDEPFNSIDLNYIYKLKEFLEREKTNATILITSHILDTLADLCDSIILLEKGSIKKYITNIGCIEELEREIFE